MKKEQLVKGKEETATIQGEYEETSKLNQQLEQQKKELQSNVDEITLQVRGEGERGREGGGRERGERGRGEREGEVVREREEREREGWVRGLKIKE